MTDWMLLMEEVVAISVLLLLGIMYLFYVKYPYNKETDRRPEDETMYARIALALLVIAAIMRIIDRSKGESHGE